MPTPTDDQIEQLLQSLGRPTVEIGTGPLPSVGEAHRGKRIAAFTLPDDWMKAPNEWIKAPPKRRGQTGQ